MSGPVVWGRPIALNDIRSTPANESLLMNGILDIRLHGLAGEDVKLTRRVLAKTRTLERRKVRATQAF